LESDADLSGKIIRKAHHCTCTACFAVCPPAEEFNAALAQETRVVAAVTTDGTLRVFLMPNPAMPISQ